MANTERLQKAMDNLTAFLKTTSALGTGTENPIKEIKVISYGEDTWARPIFADGTGEKEAFTRWDGKQHGFYDVDITLDSPDAAIKDVWDKFVRRYNL